MTGTIDLHQDAVIVSLRLKKSDSFGEPLKNHRQPLQSF